MSEWWTYRPSDFLMFAPRTYWRLFELANRDAWPLQLVVLAGGLAGWFWLWRRCRPRRGGSARRHDGLAVRAGSGLLAAGWAWVGWDFLLQRYAPINWAAEGLACGFGAQALGLLALAALGGCTITGNRRRWHAGMALIAWSLLGQPLAGLLLGRPWQQLEMLGVAPDPTLIATLGWLTLLDGRNRAARGLLRGLWLVPLLGGAISAATLWTLGSPQGWLLPAAVVLAQPPRILRRLLRLRMEPR